MTDDDVDPRTLHRRSDPVTSVHAAYLDPGRRTSQRFQILGSFVLAHPEGLTAEEAAHRAGFSRSWQRVSDLKNRGFLYTTGEQRDTSHGSPAEVYQVTDEGREKFWEIFVEEDT